MVGGSSTPTISCPGTIGSFGLGNRYIRVAVRTVGENADLIVHLEKLIGKGRFRFIGFPEADTQELLWVTGYRAKMVGADGETPMATASLSLPVTLPPALLARLPSSFQCPSRLLSPPGGTWTTGGAIRYSAMLSR